MIVTVEQPHTDTDTDTASRSADTAPTDTDTAPRSADKKIERLNTASLRRVIEPDTEVTGAVGEGQVIPSEMLTVADLGLDLSDRERATLSREELASVVISGIRFETFLMSGFAAQMACTADLTDPRIVYMLHEMGEETRHSRLFIRLVDQLQPKATDPLQARLGQKIFRGVLRTVLNRPAVFCVLVLAGEEIPDLFQKKIADHPETDPFVRDVNHYHRMEEARHLAFAGCAARAVVRSVPSRPGAGPVRDPQAHPGDVQRHGPSWCLPDHRAPPVEDVARRGPQPVPRRPPPRGDPTCPGRIGRRRLLPCGVDPGRVAAFVRSGTLGQSRVGVGPLGVGPSVSAPRATPSNRVRRNPVHGLTGSHLAA